MDAPLRGAPRRGVQGIAGHGVDRRLEVRDLRLEILDIAGRRIRNLVQGAREAGRYTLDWDRRDSDGVVVRRGVYLVRMRADEFVAARKAVVARP